jgi:hypothetical protein
MEINSRAAEIIIIILVLVGLSYAVYLIYNEIVIIKKKVNRSEGNTEGNTEEDNDDYCLELDDNVSDPSNDEDYDNGFLEDSPKTIIKPVPVLLEKFPCNHTSGVLFEIPLETVHEEPSGTLFEIPLETVHEEPSGTLFEIPLETVHEEPSGTLDLREECHSLCQKKYKIGKFKGTVCLAPTTNNATFCHKHKQK